VRPVGNGSGSRRGVTDADIGLASYIASGHYLNAKKISSYGSQSSLQLSAESDKSARDFVILWT